MQKIRSQRRSVLMAILITVLIHVPALAWQRYTINTDVLIKQRLIEFIENPNESSYSGLMRAIESAQQDTPEVHLLKGMAILLRTYDGYRSIFNDELGLTLDNFRQHSLSDLLYKFMGLSAYDEKVYSILHGFSEDLSQADTEFDKVLRAISHYPSTYKFYAISLSNGITVYFDKLDVKVMKLITNLLKAVSLYAMSLSTKANKWVVDGVNMRKVLADYLSGKSKQIDQKLMRDFLKQNPRFLSYGPYGDAMASKESIKRVQVLLHDVVKDFSHLSEYELALRSNNAFNLDDKLSLALAQAADRMMETIAMALEDPEGIIAWPEVEMRTIDYLCQDDGNLCYPVKSADIYLGYSFPYGNSTIYGLFNEKDSMRELLLGTKRIAYRTTYRNLFKRNIIFVDWSSDVSKDNLCGSHRSDYVVSQKNLIHPRSYSADSSRGVFH